LFFFSPKPRFAGKSTELYQHIDFVAGYILLLSGSWITIILFPVGLSPQSTALATFRIKYTLKWLAT